MNAQNKEPVVNIPVDQVNIVNSRSRGRERFRQIVHSIKTLGLKKPITVRPANGEHGDGAYDLVCGEGRLLAVRSLGWTHIPARVRDMPTDDLLLMSLVENLARRQVRSAELLAEVSALKERGYSIDDIAAKTALDPTYVKGVLKLLSGGHKSLLQAVDHRRIPVSVAIAIAAADDDQVQRALQEAYEQGQVKGQKLLSVRRFIARWQASAPGQRASAPDRQQLSSQKMLKVYREESARQQAVVKQAQVCQRDLLYVVSAFKHLLQDDQFVALLRAESMDSLPKYLADEVS